MADDDPRRAARRMGRPPLDAGDPTVGFRVCVPGRQYDELDREARREGLSISALVRQRYLPPPKKSHR